MNKKLDIIEKLKTAILVVLFAITILLLYLSYNQSGKNFSVSEILPSGRSDIVQLKVEDYLIPSYTVQSEGNGKFNITYKNQKTIFDTASECAAGLMNASNMSITEISLEEYEEICKEDDSIVLIFDFDFPFDEYCKKIIGKTLDRPQSLTGFNSLMFSNVIKSDLYLRNSDEKCYRLSVAENYYSTEALARVIVFDVGEIGYNYLFKLTFRNGSTENTFDITTAAEGIFGDTLDFVRKITNSNGDEIYMYGHGQKRLSIFSDGTLEFKEELKGPASSDFYQDLESALRFSKEKLGIESLSLKLVSATLVNDGEADIYHFEFDAGTFDITTEVKNAQVVYYFMSNK